MSFSSTPFLFLFLPVVICLFYLIYRFAPSAKKVFLLVFSILFYTYGERKSVFVLLASILLNWAIALLIDNMKREPYRTFFYVTGITINLGLLLVLKYTGFITRSISRFINSIPNMDFSLPAGISFFTFQAMSYVIDVYQKKEKAQRSLIEFGLFISFFPQLIAGPIVRYSSFKDDINEWIVTRNDFAEGITGFLRGLFKKIIISNNLAVVADATFTGIIEKNSVLISWLGALAYTLQLYYDFSGYSDMAIGLGRIFGFHFPKNFDYPYAFSTITDFWRRWHISLSSWFRDYVYIPLGGSRKGELLQIRNLLIVWLLTGIWHGANWTFIVWGLLYFALLVAEKFIIHPERFTHKWMGTLYRVLCYVIVILCWVIFRSETIASAVNYLKSMFGMNGNPFRDNDWTWYSREYIVFFISGLLLSTPIVRLGLRKVKSQVKPAIFASIRVVGYATMFIICISYIVTGTHNPFVYFNF